MRESHHGQTNGQTTTNNPKMLDNQRHGKWLVWCRGTDKNCTCNQPRARGGAQERLGRGGVRRWEKEAQRTSRLMSIGKDNQGTGEGPTRRCPTSMLA